MFDRFLVPVDDSDCARRAAKYGLELARRYDARVDVLHVVDTGLLPESAEGDATSRGESLLAEATAFDVDVPVETHLVEGTAHEAIASHVDQFDADLVVMGRSGRSGVEEHLLGSVTERVLRQAPVPTLTVPAGPIGDETGRTYEDVLLTTDGSETAELAAPYGAGLARDLGAILHLLTVVNPVEEAGPFDAGGITEEFLERLEAEGREALDSLESQMDTDDLTVHSALREGQVHEEVAAYADDEDVDVLVMASEGETNLVGQQVGSTARRLLATVERPVLVVPSPA